MDTTARTATARSMSLRKDSLLYSRMLLTVDKASGSTTATSSFGKIFTDQKYDSEASRRASTGFSRSAFLRVAGGWSLITLPIQRRFLVGGEQEGDEDKGLEPADVGVEPVVDGELEGDDQRRRERREPPDRPLLKHHGDDKGE